MGGFVKLSEVEREIEQPILIPIAEDIFYDDGVSFDAKNDNGLTPLHIALNNKRFKIVEWLLRHGVADVNAKKNDGWTPLHSAVYYNSKETAKLLIENGADVNSRKHNEETPLIIAARAESYGVAKLLLDNGAHVNATSSGGEYSGYTAVDWAWKNQDFKMLLLLSKRKTCPMCGQRIGGKR